MTSGALPEEIQFLIDFNLHCVPAAMGLPVNPVAGAEMFEITEEQFVAYAAEVEGEVAETAAALLSDPEIARGIDSLVVPAGGTMMAIGDSITTYRRSYARLLAAMVQLRRPDDSVTFVNVAQSGYTSSHGLENVYTQFLGQQPDWVSLKFGVNDCKRFGAARGGTLVSISEYRKNMSEMVEAFLSHTSARPVLITPVPVVEESVNANPDFQQMRMIWDNADVCARADVVRDLARTNGLPLVDLVELFGEKPEPDQFLDGLHPGPDAHQLIVRELLRALPPNG